jgi:anti-sigma factor RsiW
MSEQAQEDEARRYLSALADGESDELTAEQRDTVLHHLATHPQAAAWLAAEVQLRQAVSQYLAKGAALPSDALRERIQDLARAGEMAFELSSTKQPAVTAPSPRRPMRAWFIWPAAAAAMVFLAVGLWMGREIYGGSPSGGGPVPATLVADVTHIHVDCSRAPELHNAPFPKELGNLEGSLEKYLGRPVPWPDLSSIGYKYIGAGPCAKPLENTAHLLYRAIGGPVTDTVSLFVQRDGPQDLQEGKVYWAAGKDAAHPMIVWRRDNMTFYLVGDADKPVIQAARVMGVAVPL